MLDPAVHHRRPSSRGCGNDLMRGRQLNVAAFRLAQARSTRLQENMKASVS